jgi:hypothetical protein
MDLLDEHSFSGGISREGAEARRGAVGGRRSVGAEDVTAGDGRLGVFSWDGGFAP